MLIEHLAGCLISHRNSHMPVEGFVTDMDRRYWSSSSRLRCLRDSHCLLHCCTTLNILQLVEHILPVVSGLSHALVEVVQGRVRHLKGLR